MSIYFQYPSIEDYPITVAPAVVNKKVEEPVKDTDLNPLQLEELRDYLNLKPV